MEDSEGREDWDIWAHITSNDASNFSSIRSKDLILARFERSRERSHEYI